jgi:hypothetical protein
MRYVGIIGVGQAGMAAADDLLHDLGDGAEDRLDAA